MVSQSDSSPRLQVHSKGGSPAGDYAPSSLLPSNGNAAGGYGPCNSNAISSSGGPQPPFPLLSKNNGCSSGDTSPHASHTPRHTSTSTSSALSTAPAEPGQGAYPSQRDGKGSSGVPGVLCQGARQGGSESTADLLAPPCAVPPPGNMTLPASSSAREDLGTGSSSGGCSSTRGGSGGSGGGSMRGSSMRSSGGGGIGRSIEPMLTEVRSLKLTVTAALASLSGSGRPQASLTGSSKPVSPVNDALGQVEALSSQLPAQLARVDHLLEQLEAYRASAEQRQRPGNNANSIATQLRLLLQNLMRWRRTVVWPPAPTASLTASSREERCSRSAPQPGYLEPKQPASSSCQELESQLRQPQPVAGTSAVTGASLPGTGVASQLVEVALDLLIASPADLTAPHLSANGVGAVEALSLSSEPGPLRNVESESHKTGDGRRSSTMFGSALPQHLVRLISTSAAPLVNAAASSGPTALQTLAPILTPKGIASIFGFTPQRTSTPLDEALPAVITPERSSVPTVRPVLMTSVMPSGTQLATIDSLSPISSLALFVDTGSIYESEETSGATKLLTSLAFKATTNRTTFRLTRELEKLGCSAHATSGRDFAAFSVEFVRMHAPEAAEILIDSVVNAKLNYWEVRENMEAVKDALAEALKNPANVIGEVLHRAAFDGPLGQPLLVDPSQLTLDNDALKAFIAASFQPSRMVLAGVGIDHDEANELSSPLLSYGGARGPPASAAASKYVGGGISVIAPSASTHFALGFEAKGGLSEAKTEALSAVVAALMEEARPTLPRMSRETGVVGSVSSFSHLYKGTGIVGVIGGAAPAQASQLVDAVCKKVEAIAKGVSDAALASAKMVAIGAYTDKLATTPGMLSLMGPHMLFNGKFDAFVFSATVATLTPADVANFVQKGLKSGPTFVTYGNLGSLPRYESIARRFVEKV
ncbi:MAG: hypothetical protein WDW38_003122 [Sanguina aurantia]